MYYRFFRLFVVLASLFAAIAPVYGQDASGDGSTNETALTVDIRNKTLPEVLTQLQQLSGCSFLYDQSIVGRVPKITLRMQNVSLSTILDRIADITRLKYTRVDNTITFASGGVRPILPHLLPQQVRGSFRAG